VLLIGTKKGGFILEGDRTGRDWSVRGPLFDGWGIQDMTLDPATGSIYAGARNPFYGPAVFRSTDFGRTWDHSSAGLTYGEDGPPVAAVWSVTPARGVLYAGVDPAGLFRSDDGGETWSHVAGLRAHPSRPDWQAGAGGLILHTIVPHPTDPRSMWVAISAVGTFVTNDGGSTWRTQNRGVRADFLPDPFPEFGQCVHKLALAAGTTDRLYQQNHCGVYRSTDGGDSWDDLSDALPSRFGFALAAHPRDPMTAWTFPLNGAELGRFAPDGSPAVYRTTDGGDTWARLGTGWPTTNAYVGVLRESMATDAHDPVGVYVGTSTGELFASSDEGESWRLIAEYLPPIWSVDVARTAG
jgi:hypothetical protein